ncbi:uncharacterized protein ACBT44_008961 isoform 2-T2 [Syngnathus typhle]
MIQPNCKEEPRPSFELGKRTGDNQDNLTVTFDQKTVMSPLIMIIQLPTTVQEEYTECDNVASALRKNTALMEEPLVLPVAFRVANYSHKDAMSCRRNLQRGSEVVNSRRPVRPTVHVRARI